MADFVAGAAQLSAYLRRLEAKGPMAMAGALFAEANDIMGKAKDLAPVDQGNLRGSGTVQPPDVSGTRVEVEFGFGGAASDYVVAQHERLDYNHTVGQAKFLEQPTNEAANGLEGRLAAKVRPFLERG